MNNAFLVYYNDEPFITLLIPTPCYLSITQLLDKYAKIMGLNRSALSGCYIKCIDISDMSDGLTRHPSPKYPEKF